MARPFRDVEHDITRRAPQAFWRMEVFGGSFAQGFQPIARSCQLRQMSGIEVSVQFRSVQADLQIATALAVRDLTVVAIFNSFDHLSAVNCLYIQNLGQKARSL